MFGEVGISFRIRSSRAQFYLLQFYLCKTSFWGLPSGPDIQGPFHDYFSSLEPQITIDWVYLGVKTCDIFSLFCQLVLGFGYCLMVSWLFCFLCFTSSVSLTSFYTEDEPINCMPFLDPKVRDFAIHIYKEKNLIYQQDFVSRILSLFILQVAGATMKIPKFYHTNTIAA